MLNGDQHQILQQRIDNSHQVIDNWLSDPCSPDNDATITELSITTSENSRPTLASLSSFNHLIERFMDFQGITLYQNQMNLEEIDAAFTLLEISGWTRQQIHICKVRRSKEILSLLTQESRQQLRPSRVTGRRYVPNQLQEIWLTEGDETDDEDRFTSDKVPQESLTSLRSPASERPLKKLASGTEILKHRETDANDMQLLRVMQEECNQSMQQDGLLPQVDSSQPKRYWMR
jgi:hypothetical protein